MPANRLLLGQIALERGSVTREQLRECLELQAGQAQPRPLGTLLLDSGFLIQPQLSMLLDEQARRLREGTPYAPAPKEELAFGRLLVKRGHLIEARLNEALRAQQDLADRNVRKRLGELLVAAGHLSVEAVHEVLRIQGKVLMSCTFCGSHRNVLRTLIHRAVCGKCGMPLEEKSVELEAGETAYLLPAVDVSTLRAVRVPPVEPAPRAAAPIPAPSPAPAAPPKRRDVILALVVLGVVLLMLFLLSR